MARDTYEMTSPRHALYYASRVATYIPPTVCICICICMYAYVCVYIYIYMHM